MAIASPKTAADRFLHALTGCVPNLCGDVTLEPSNYILDWRLDNLDDDNEPLSFSLGRPEDPDGFWVYMSAKDGAPSTLAAQNTERISMEEDTYYLKTDYVAGHAPTDARFAAQVAAPDAPSLELKSASTDGFAAGTYLMSYTWVNGDKHTALAPAISVTVGLGQYIRVTLPQDYPDGADYIAIWMTPAQQDVSQMRLQEFVPVNIRPRPDRLLKGPFRTKRATPTRNETIIAVPKAPTLARVKREGGLTQPGSYKARITRVDPRSERESNPSEFSNEIVLTQEEADKGIGVATDVEISGNYYIYITLNGKEYRLNTDTSGATLGSRRPHSSERSTRTGRRRRQSNASCARLRHVTTGRTSSERASSSDPRRDELIPDSPTVVSTSTTSNPANPAFIGAGPRGFNADAEIEDPTAPLDGAVAEGAVRISPGKYWVALSYAVRGEETTISPPEQITITSGNVGVVKLPDSNNLLLNAQWADRDANGLPDTWSLTGTAGGTGGGAVYYDANGGLVLDTLGSKTGTTPTPATFQDVEISRDQFYAIGGKLSTILTSGSANVMVDEYSETNSLLRSSAIASIPSTGANMTFNTVFGPGYVAFHPDTDYLILKVHFAGSTREGRIFLHELYVNPGSSRRLRRTTSPLPQSRDFTDASPPTNTRWNKESIVGVMLPPVVSGYTPNNPAPIATQDFESSDMKGFTLRQSSTSGTVAERGTAWRINGSYGYRLFKNTASSRALYLWRDIGLTQHNHALNFTLKVAKRPTKAHAYLAAIRSSQTDGWPTSSNFHVAPVLGSDGNMWLNYSDSAGRDQWIKAASGIANGDILDIEISVLGAGTSNATASLSVGKNGATRKVLASKSGINYSGKFARYSYVGPYALTDNGLLCDFYYDDIVITATGNFATGGAALSGPAEGYPYEQSDRPTLPADVIEDVSFATGALPAGGAWTTVRNPTDSSTAVVVETGAKIDGTYGVRCTDTNTTTLASAYLKRTLLSSEVGSSAGGGFRVRERIVIRPGTGQIDLMSLTSSGGQTLGRFRLDNIGDLYAQTLNASAVLHAQTRVARNITNNTILTLEIVLSGVGTAAGTASYWLSVGGTGDISERSLFAQHALVPWSGLNITALNAGIVAESVAGATSTVHVDTIRISTSGEGARWEVDEEGNSLYQMYFYYPSGTPVRDDLGPKDLELAVQPNETFTFAVAGRHADVPLDAPSYPFSFYAFDTAGTEYPLGSVYGDGGATGTSGWTDLSLVMTIPDDCYILTMRSEGISSGEYVYQVPAFCRGTEVSREVIYPESGQVWAILDTLTPQSFAFAPEGGNPQENRWLDIAAIVDAPEGTSSSIQYNSADPHPEADILGTEQPTSWLTNPLSVTPRRYAHFLISLNASSDLRRTPTLRMDTPYVDYYARIRGEQVSVLLRDDLSEFDGGVHLFADMPFFSQLSAFDVRQPRGQVIRNPRYDPVGDLGGFTMRAYTRQAIRDIEENCLSLDFAIETRDYRLIVRFRDQVEFGGFTNTRKVQGVWCTQADASVDGVEVVEAIPVNALLESLVAP